MQKFTVKDFIAYNNPCFSCGENIYLSFNCTDKRSGDVGSFRPTVKPDHTSIDLKVTYNDSLQLWIFHQSNKIVVSDPNKLAPFLLKNDLSLHVECKKCYTNIHSDFLEFNLDKAFIKPVSLLRETLIVTDDDNRYHVHTSFANNESTIIIDRISKPTPVNALRFEAPLMPLFKFKDKEHFITKMKTYIIFS